MATEGRVECSIEVADHGADTQHGSSKAVEDGEDELLDAKAAFRSGNHTLAAGLDSGDEHLAESKYSCSTPDRPSKSGFSANEREKESEDKR